MIVTNAPISALTMMQVSATVCTGPPGSEPLIFLPGLREVVPRGEPRWRQVRQQCEAGRERSDSHHHPDGALAGCWVGTAIPPR